jgi:hypothetical protein
MVGTVANTRANTHKVFHNEDNGVDNTGNNFQFPQLWFRYRLFHSLFFTFVF